MCRVSLCASCITTVHDSTQHHASWRPSPFHVRSVACHVGPSRRSGHDRRSRKLLPQGHPKCISRENKSLTFERSRPAVADKVRGRDGQSLRPASQTINSINTLPNGQGLLPPPVRPNRGHTQRGRIQEGEIPSDEDLKWTDWW